MADLSMDKPATRRDIKTLVKAVSGENFYIKSEEYRRKTGLGKTWFQKLKKLGKFDKGTHPATLGSKRILIHKYFNVLTQDIELPGITITPNKRGKNGKVKKNKTGSSAAAGASELAKEQPQGRSDDASGQHLPGSAQQPQA